MQQSELFTKCAATCLPFAHLPISPYFPPPRGYWWFERSSAEMMKGKGKYVTHPHTSITGTAARCFWKAWHINIMHSKRTVMDNILTFGRISTWNNESLCRELFFHWHDDGEPWEKRWTLWTSSDKNTPWTPPSPPAAPSKHLMLEERSTSCNQKKKMKGTVWAAVWIVFFCSEEQGLLGGACLQ